MYSTKCVRVTMLLSLLLVLSAAAERPTYDPVFFREPTENEEFCKTPTGNTGICKNIRQCPSVINLLTTSKRPVPEKTVQYVQSLSCGFEGENTKVCCTADTKEPLINEPTTTTTQKTTIQDRANITCGETFNVPLTPPDITNHTNYKLLPTNCGPSDGLNRIVGGNRTRLTEFPWMALLNYGTATEPEFRCGGTLINDRYILTAAHCITNLGKLVLRGVRLGDHNVNKEVDCEVDGEPGNEVEFCAPPYQDFEIEEILPHPFYHTKLFSNDIGLIRMKTKPNTTVETVRPVCLPVNEPLRNFNFTGRNLTVTGWGATENGQASEELLKADLPVQPFENCRSAYAKTVPITHLHICAGGVNETEACKGDSGGPLQMVDFVHEDVRYVQHGIVSFGTKRLCGIAGYPGVYTRIAYYMDWVVSNMRP